MLANSLSAGADCQQMKLEHEPVGYWVAQRILDEAELMNLVVFSPYQSRGLGRKTLTKIQNKLADKGVKTIFLEVRVRNVAAIGLYEALGFTKINTRKGYYAARADAPGQKAEDALIMRSCL